MLRVEIVVKSPFLYGGQGPRGRIHADIPEPLKFSTIAVQNQPWLPSLGCWYMKDSAEESDFRSGKYYNYQS